MTRAVLRWISGLLTAAGLAFMAAALWSDLDRLDRSLLPPVGQSAGLVILLATSLVVSYAMWLVVLGVRASPRSMSAYMGAQVAKYVPGGVWQGVGQVVGHTTIHAETSVVTTTVSYLVQAAAQVAAAAPLAAVVLVLVRPRQPLVLAGVLGSIGGGLLIVRPLMAMGLRWAGRWRTVWADQLTLPPPSRIWAAAGLGVVTLVLQGFVLSRLVDDGEISWIRVMCAYGVAWAVGFAAVPLPNGLGLREFMLVSLVPGVPAGVMVAASLVLRFGQLLAEAILLAATQASRHFRGEHRHPSETS